MSDAGDFLLVGLSHRTAPIAVRERLGSSPDRLRELLARARAAGVLEAAIVSTCNRFELYAAAPDPDAALARLRELVGGPHADVARALYAHTGREAVRHLFRVASSLDSMVVGEPQIAGQVKDGFRLAREAGADGPRLERALARALGAAKRVRSETGIAEGLVSVASVAVELTRKIFGELKGRSVLLVGAGEMATAAARALRSAGTGRLVVANRTAERAEALAAEFGGEPAPTAALPSLLEAADIVLSSTGAAGFMLDHALVAAAVKARRYRPLFLIDLAVPRDIDPRCNELENTYLYDLDDLDQVAAATRTARAGEAEKAEAIIEVELAAFVREQAVRAATGVLSEFRARAAEVAAAEAERTLKLAGPLNERQAASVKSMAQAIVNKLLHQPAAALRAEAEALGAGGPLADAAAVLFLGGAAPQGAGAKAAPTNGSAAADAPASAPTNGSAAADAPASAPTSAPTSGPAAEESARAPTSAPRPASEEDAL